MLIAAGWGARLREERELHQFPQTAFATANTQRAYENETNSPTIRYLELIEDHGLDVHYILSGSRSRSVLSREEAEVIRAWQLLPPEARGSFLYLMGFALGSGRVPEPDFIGDDYVAEAKRTPPLHEDREGYQPKREAGGRMNK
jgi:hypothetical protein